MSALPAKAGYVVNLAEVGGNVVATGSGSINSNELSGSFPSVGIDEIIPSSGVILIDEPVADEFLIPATGPGSFGPGGPTIADSASGDIVGISGGAAAVIVPLGYISGSALSSTATWDDTTFSKLGVTPGTYVWQLGNGNDDNFFTLNIDPTGVVAEPSTWAMMLLGFAGLGWAGYRGRAASRATGEPS
ncbi:MAG TPA: PEP-CTERM sorting domain-containing protein [Roseiarcus sp.]|nr:PEP-CTERM sorting domain-containing protein [Roseiarcus sp.]